MKIKFLNHACILVEIANTQIIFDPWFFGKIFNESWSLLKETDEAEIDYQKLKYIIVSHEHPDHFHPPTLKKIANITKNKIKFIFPERINDNVKKYVESIGFEYLSIQDQTIVKIDNLFDIFFLKINDDSAIILKHENKVLFNQNDAYLIDEQCEYLKNQFPQIDYWFFQFSLAGYYGNKNKPKEIQSKGTNFHIGCFMKYKYIFKPKFSIPFASFVYFCKEYNKYINSYAVKIRQLNELCNNELTILYYNELLNENRTLIENEKSLIKWEKALNIQELNIYGHKIIEKDSIINAAKKSIEEAFIKKRVLNYDIYMDLYDDSQIFYINYAKKQVSFIDKKDVENNKIIGILALEELKFFFDFPWGADTLNITGCFETYNNDIWRQFLMYKDSLYER